MMMVAITMIGLDQGEALVRRDRGQIKKLSLTKESERV